MLLGASTDDSTISGSATIVVRVIVEGVGEHRRGARMTCNGALERRTQREVIRPWIQSCKKKNKQKSVIIHTVNILLPIIVNAAHCIVHEDTCAWPSRPSPWPIGQLPLHSF